ncbi:FixH family protein [Brevibacillus fluminis]|uniref:FixH family protein n=1 Tax=Brevibacillus fluminis TaxID=511487 RepID=UPI003F8A0EF6
MLHRAFAAVFMLLLLIATGCAASKQADPASSVAQPNKEFAISITPAPAVSLKENKLVLALTAEQQQAWGNATVSVKLGMDGMEHGEEAVAAEAKGEGRYEATVIPTMAGPWIAHITIAGDQGEKQVAFPFEAVR